ncbi:hypothetical protein BN2475_170065 [Paraburkholderia ribeironis]|uniref:Uncharacterized protein n=1 Tax=Paraburkholderia ribeironis TaxID=1247936 RepID=A0A1N7RUP4_9BURK|nr:hypothetical protein BN2475_170065 [Paraburkholderia ribeironis]
MRIRYLEGGDTASPSSKALVAGNVAVQRRFRQDHVVRTPSACMADRLELVALALPPRSLPTARRAVRDHQEPGAVSVKRGPLPAGSLL